VIDSGYRGELMIKLSKIDGKDYYTINERVGQLMILPYPKIEFEEVDQLNKSSRGTGGFGSTGKS
jgi:dUTP pyrophosphatase